MKKTMLTCDTLDRFEKFINPETLTAEQVQEVEHLAYCANMGAESKESAWTRFCELVKHFLNLDIIDTERHPNIRKAIADHEAETLNRKPLKPSRTQHPKRNPPPTFSPR